jgi:hypothetical protein
MSDKKKGITMADIVNVKSGPVVPKIKKPGITTNTVNVPAPPPRAEGPFVRGPIITTHDLPPTPQYKVVIEETKPGARNLATAMGEAFDADAKAYADKVKAESPAPAPIAKRKPAARKRRA